MTTTAKAMSVTLTQTATLTKLATHTAPLSVTLTQTPTVTALAGNHTTASGSESAPTYQIKTVNMTGTVGTTLTLAEPDRVKWTLNQPDEFSFHFPKGAYANTDVATLQAGGTVTEAQIYRNSDLLTWGPVVQLHAQGSDGAVTCQGAGVDWYLNRRFIDGTITNYLTNPDFESGTTGWTTNGSPTVTSDTSNYQVGSKSVKLVGTAMAGQNISQAFATTPSPIGVLIVVSGWFYLESFTGMATQDAYGLFMEGYETLGAYQGNNYWPIDSATPRNQWVKARFQMWVPPNKSWVINVKAYAPGGTIYYDDIKAVAMLSVSTETDASGHQTPVDISTIVRQIVNHVQQTSVGKSNLNIGVNTNTVGINQARSYQYVDHMQFDTAMREFIERDDGIDYYIDYTPKTRTFHQFAHKRGTDRHLTVTLKYKRGDATSNCSDYTLVDDAGACVTHETMLGEDNGPDREQGDYSDSSNTAGIVLEDVRQAPQQTKVDSLQAFARDVVKRKGTVPRTIEMQLLGSSGLIPTIKCGDLVKVDINDGWSVVSAVTYRIMSIELDCKTNIATVTVTKDDLS